MGPRRHPSAPVSAAQVAQDGPRDAEGGIRRSDEGKRALQQGESNAGGRQPKNRLRSEDHGPSFQGTYYQGDISNKACTHLTVQGFKRDRPSGARTGLDDSNTSPSEEA